MCKPTGEIFAIKILDLERQDPGKLVRSVARTVVLGLAPLSCQPPPRVETPRLASTRQRGGSLAAASPG